MNKEISIYVISDSIGETGELIARAAVKQFVSEKDYDIRRYAYIETEEQVEEIFKEAQEETRSLVIYTTVSERTRKYITKKGIELNIPTIDVMTPPLQALESVLGFPPKRESGIIRRLDENYFNKVAAIEFAVKYDDGKDPRGIKKAEICLVGVSRTSKTPLSMYLAHKYFKVANVPLVPEVPPPRELFEKDRRRVIGLVANPLKLNEVRQERLKSLGLRYNANYADINRINEELEYSRNIMKKLGCIVIDVSNKAIEETAGIVIDHMIDKFGQKSLL
ncbi:MAG TPA: pyruvate, water dikinase regulatory protein [Tissierellaceae bacterium]|nr:pyruvate, water dikinase regulatory protein [Tissierellaceae bacterium]